MADDATGVKETDEQGPGGGACCSSSPASGGSCCGSTVKPVTASSQSACCGAPTKRPPQERRQSSCCGAPATPPADYPYGPAAYVVGAIETPVGAVPRVSREITRGDRLGAWRVRWGFGPRRLPGEAGPVRRGIAGRRRPRAGHRQLQAHLRRAALVARRSRRLAAGRRHARHQRLVRGRQGHLLRRRGRARGPRDATRRGRRAPAPRAAAACGAGSRRSPGQRSLWLSGDLRAGAGRRPAGLSGRRHEGRLAHARRHLRCPRARRARARRAAGRLGPPHDAGLRRHPGRARRSAATASRSAGGAPRRAGRRRRLACPAGGWRRNAARPALVARPRLFRERRCGGRRGGGGCRGAVSPSALAGRKARPAGRRAGRLLLCRHELHRLLADHLAIGRRARDAPGAASGRSRHRVVAAGAWLAGRAGR